MLYPAELQALPQARRCTITRCEMGCLGHSSEWRFTRIRHEGKGKPQFLTRRSPLITQTGKFACLCTSEEGFFMAKGPSESNDRNVGLDAAGAMHDSISLHWNAHGPASERTTRV